MTHQRLREKTEAFLAKAREAGCTPSIQGNWVVFTPTLPVNLILEIGDLGDAIRETIDAALNADREK